MTEPSSTTLKRYTLLPFLMDLLKRKKLVFVDPKNWYDKNDVATIREYEKRKNLKLFALCFTSQIENIHHWKTYADGISGCCVEFNKEKLLESFQDIKEVESKNVTYKTQLEWETHQLNNVHTMPFTKRLQYQWDAEFRILWKLPLGSRRPQIYIDLSCINKIILSPELHGNIFRSTKQLLVDALDDLPIKVVNSTVYKSERWVASTQNK